MQNPKIKPNLAIQEKHGYISRKSEMGAVVMDSEKHRVLEVNETGLFILKQCNGKNTVEEMVKSLCDEYEVSEVEAKEDVEKFIAKLKDLKLLV